MTSTHLRRLTQAAVMLIVAVWATGCTRHAQTPAVGEDRAGGEAPVAAGEEAGDRPSPTAERGPAAAAVAEEAPAVSDTARAAYGEEGVAVLRALWAMGRAGLVGDEAKIRALTQLPEEPEARAVFDVYTRWMVTSVRLERAAKAAYGEEGAAVVMRAAGLGTLPPASPYAEEMVRGAEEMLADPDPDDLELHEDGVIVNHPYGEAHLRKVDGTWKLASKDVRRDDDPEPQPGPNEEDPSHGEHYTKLHAAMAAAQEALAAEVEAGRHKTAEDAAAAYGRLFEAEAERQGLNEEPEEDGNPEVTAQFGYGDEKLADVIRGFSVENLGYIIFVSDRQEILADGFSNDSVSAVYLASHDAVNLWLDDEWPARFTAMDEAARDKAEGVRRLTGTCDVERWESNIDFRIRLSMRAEGPDPVAVEGVLTSYEFRPPGAD